MAIASRQPDVSVVTIARPAAAASISDLEKPSRYEGRATMVRAGRLRVEANYTQQLIAPRLAALLTEAAGSRRRDATA
jgi:hypothetical protein